jgi:hypothetical protein
MRLARVAWIAIVLGLVLAAARCETNVPLGVAPPSDAATDGTDAGAGD